MGIQLNIEPYDQYLAPLCYPMVISGPCSAESEEQVVRTAEELSCIPQVRIFRAGIWKPRTRPGGFEGSGEEGLKWMRKAKKASGLLTATEVARPLHAELAMKHDIDVLWIGARSTVNPFLVQEIAESLRGTDIPVFVKNPVNPDLKLWIGAFERLCRAGINKLSAIHRGFYFFEKSMFRNAPMWEIPIELKRQAPEIPLIVDPSHICGNKNMLKDIAQKAMDLNMCGLMLESHYRPNQALTDREQQISPAELRELLSSLVIRKQKGTPEFENKLESLRTEIDKIDTELLDILARRMDITREIAQYKKENSITILQLKRWQNIISDRLNSGTNMGLDRAFLKNLLNLVHKESIQLQNQIMNNPDAKTESS